MSPSKILLFVSIAFILGVTLETFIDSPQFLLWAFLFIALALITTSIFHQKIILLLVGLLCIGLLLGVERMQITEWYINSNTIKQMISGNKVEVNGVVADDPDVRDDNQKLKVRVGDGFILVTTDRVKTYSYLDSIRINGKIQEPPVFEDFNYKNYLLKDKIYALSNYPDIVVLLERHKYNVGSFLYEKIIWSKHTLQKSIREGFSFDQKSIAEGVVLGDTGAMSENLKNKLNLTGLRHLTAISGANIIIVGAIVVSFLIFLGFSRTRALLVSFFFIWIYIMLTGGSASGVRAGIMGSVLLIAQFLGRQNTGSRIITLTATLMLLHNPMLLVYDVGFQLSFLACVGIIYLKPSLDFLINRVMKNKLKLLSEAATTTFSAQIFTLPIMIYNFGYFSYVALFTNILVAPVVSLILVLGFLFALASLFSDGLAFIFLPPSWLLITYLLKITDFFAKPWAAMSFNRASWIWLIAMYAVVIIFTVLLQKRIRDIRIY